MKSLKEYEDIAMTVAAWFLGYALIVFLGGIATLPIAACFWLVK